MCGGRGAHQNSLPEIEAKLERMCLGVKYNFLKALKFLFLCVCVCQSEFLHLRASRLELEELDRDTGTARASRLMDR